LSASTEARCRVVLSVLLGVLVCVLLAACSHNPSRVRVAERSSGALNGRGYYVVQRGDTLSQIAQSYGMDYRALARYNSVRYPYVIKQGQKLWLHDRGRTVTSRSTKGSGSGTARTAPAAKTKSVARSSASSVSSEAWMWPTSGEVIAGFKTSGKVNKGINISGKMGQMVNAARSGEVVYAGEGLKSYGLLVIIKHDGQYISAYAYNRRAYVHEGDKVKKGQRIAQMGVKQGEQAQLHFEIRRNGLPVDPIRLLPRK
jgi:lipoprotein NlpD